MRLLRSFGFAFGGIAEAIAGEMNFRIHIVAAVTVFIFSCLYGISRFEAALLVMVICLVMAAELLNTAVEAMVDIISPKKCRMAKIAKDSAAGAVLIFAIGAVIIAICVFSEFDKLMAALKFIQGSIIWVIIYVALCAVFVFAVPYKRTNKLKENTGEKR